MNYNSQLQSNNTDLQQVLETLQHKAVGGGQPSGVCPSLTINYNSWGSINYIYYSTNNEINSLLDKSSFPIVIQNVDINMPIILKGYSADQNYLVPNISNLINIKELYNDPAVIGIICKCTSTEPAILNLEEEGGLG